MTDSKPSETREQARIFGTDGIRGRAGEGWLATATVSALGRAIGTVMGASAAAASRGRALLGHDGRRSGPELEQALARGLAAAGFSVESTGLITTPGLSMIARSQDFDLGVMISASHNPAEDNGIKVFTSEGMKLSDAVELEIEGALRANPDPVEEGSAARLNTDLELGYLGYLTGQAAQGLKLDGLSIVLDCANGGACRIGPRVFGRLGAQLSTICAEPDGENINRDCGSTQPQALQEEVRRREAQIGIALDGDGDRCILIDETGAVVHGDGILMIIARHAALKAQLPDPRIVATVMSNRGLHRALREVGVEVVTVPVGDRHVVEAIRREGLTLGGEQSGHVIFGADNFFAGDGIYTALRVLRVLRETGKPLSELAAPYQPFPQVLLNVPVSRQPSLADMPRVAEAVRGVEQELGADGRVLLRYSGTEPLLRVMVEGPDAAMIRQRAQSLADVIVASIG